MKLRGRGIVITGASQGLGGRLPRLAFEKALMSSLRPRCKFAGANARRARFTSFGRATGDGPVRGCQRLRGVHRLFETAASKLPQLDGLVNNAGVYGPMGLLEEVPMEEWWRAVETNLLGVMLGCREILPIFRRQGHGKIVILSGGGATSPLPRISAYAASKAAVVRLAETLAEETRGTGIDVNAIAPGALNTRLLDQVLAEGPEKVGTGFFERALQQKEQGGTPLTCGADLCVFLLSSASDGISGKLISAIWDPWPELQKHVGELNQTDVYTLRRIVPADRGLKWE